jgi:hypothetical protein
MGDSVKVKRTVSAVWARKREFNWNELMIIFPDLHLMTGMTSSVWRVPPGDPNGRFYDMRAELDFFECATQIAGAPGLESHLKIIQLGDTYDLWIGSETVTGTGQILFEKNDTCSMNLEDPVKLTFSGGKSFAANRGEVLQRWSHSVEGAELSTKDPRVQVLQWWVKAIQGEYNSPAERFLPGLPSGMNWVQYLILRRSETGRKQVERLHEIDENFRSKKINGKDTALQLKAGFPADFEQVPDEPRILAGRYAERLQPEVDRVSGWITHIAGRLRSSDANARAYSNHVDQKLGGVWLNPAEAALRLLDEQCGGVTYLYGNHDNFLIRDEVRGDTCSKRHRFLDNAGVFIEHAHRLETGLLPPWDANYDGAHFGCKSVIDLWRSRSDGVVPGMKGSWWDKAKDSSGEWLDDHTVAGSQIYYKNEAGRFLVGRYVTGQRLPHIFVIGHTHSARMDLNFVYLNSATDVKGPGRMSGAP